MRAFVCRQCRVSKTLESFEEVNYKPKNPKLSHTHIHLDL